MAREPQEIPTVFRIDVGPAATQSSLMSQNKNAEGEVVSLLRQLVTSQQRQNELLEDLVDQMHAGQRQRAAELG